MNEKDLQLVAIWQKRIDFFLNRKDWEEALKAADLAIQDFPSFYLFYNIRGTILIRLNREKEAVFSFEKALSFTSASETACLWANLSNCASGYFLVERYEDCLATLEVISALPENSDPTNHLHCLYMKVMALLKSGRSTSAIKACDESLYQDDFRFLNIRAMALFFSGSLEEALKCLEKSIAIRSSPEALQLKQAVTQNLKSKEHLSRMPKTLH